MQLSGQQQKAHHLPFQLHAAELPLTIMTGVVRSVVYDMNKSNETFEWYDIQNSEPEDCRVGTERIGLSELARKPTLPKTPAPRALISGASASASKVHKRPSGGRH